MSVSSMTGKEGGPPVTQTSTFVWVVWVVFLAGIDQGIQGVLLRRGQWLVAHPACFLRLDHARGEDSPVIVFAYVHNLQAEVLPNTVLAFFRLGQSQVAPSIPPTINFYAGVQGGE